MAVLLTTDAAVYKPDGEPLVILRRRAFSEEAMERAYPALHELRKQGSFNRGSYAGLIRPTVVNEDGSARKTTNTVDEEGRRARVATAVVGYFDRQGGRFPFCRQTAFTADEVEQWATIVPLATRAAELFERELPIRYAKQRAIADRTHPDFVIAGTPFTTLTVNNNVRAAIHRDKGDFKEGMGIISVCRRGDYAGAHLVFPQYRVAVDLHDGDLLFFNAHDWHANTALDLRSEDAERISIVYYFRHRMVDCGSAAEELARAKARGAIA